MKLYSDFFKEICDTSRSKGTNVHDHKIPHAREEVWYPIVITVRGTVVSYHLLEQFTKIQLEKRLHGLFGDRRKIFKQPKNALSKMFNSDTSPWC